MADPEPVTIIIDDIALTDQPNTVVGNPDGTKAGGFGEDDPSFPSRFNQSIFMMTDIYGDGGWFFSFDGTSAALYGVTPPLAFNQTIGFSTLPFDTKRDLSLSDPSTYPPRTYAEPAAGGLIFATPTLIGSDASNIEIGFTGETALAIDYAVVTVGPLTDIHDQNIIVDDVSQEIFWSGQWTARTDVVVPVPCLIPFDTDLNSTSGDQVTPFTANMKPHAGTSHHASAVGDGFVFQFAGTSLHISGITPSKNTGGSDWVLNMAFTLISNPANGTNPTPIVNATTATFTRDVTDPTRPHFTYYFAPELPAGNHTLVGKIISAEGTPTPQAQLDYIVYRPAFTHARDKPLFDAQAAANAFSTVDDVAHSAASKTVASSSSAAAKTGAAQSGAARPGASKSSAEIPTAAIAGAVVGGVVFLALFAMGVFCIIRRRRRRAKTPLAPAFTDGGTSFFAGAPSTFYAATLAAPPVPGPKYAGSYYEPSINPIRTQFTGRDSIYTTATSPATVTGGSGSSNPSNAELQANMRELQGQVAALTDQLRRPTMGFVSSPPSYRGGPMSDIAPEDANPFGSFGSVDRTSTLQPLRGVREDHISL